MAYPKTPSTDVVAPMDGVRGNYNLQNVWMCDVGATTFAGINYEVMLQSHSANASSPQLSSTGYLEWMGVRM